MKPNRSMPTPVVTPVLRYADVREAVAWLSAAFGFAERVRIADHRAQLSIGAGAAIVAEGGHEGPQPVDSATHSVMVRVDDVDAHCERARAHGARVLMEPADFPYGERQYAAEDLAGHRWTFSQTIDDVAPEAWGGMSVTDG